MSRGCCVPSPVWWTAARPEACVRLELDEYLPADSAAHTGHGDPARCGWRLGAEPTQSRMATTSIACLDLASWFSFSLIRDYSAGFMIGCHACNRRLAVRSDHTFKPASGRMWAACELLSGPGYLRLAPLRVGPDARASNLTRRSRTQGPVGPARSAVRRPPDRSITKFASPTIIMRQRATQGLARPSRLGHCGSARSAGRRARPSRGLGPPPAPPPRMPGATSDWPRATRRRR